MFVSPTLVSSLSRGSFKTESQGGYLVLQQYVPTVKAKRDYSSPPTFRILTRGFPHYKIAEGYDENDIKATWDIIQIKILPRIQGKITSRKLANFVKVNLNELLGFSNSPKSALLSASSHSSMIDPNGGSDTQENETIRPETLSDQEIVEKLTKIENSSPTRRNSDPGNGLSLVDFPAFPSDPENTNFSPMSGTSKQTSPDIQNQDMVERVSLFEDRLFSPIPVDEPLEKEKEGDDEDCQDILANPLGIDFKSLWATTIMAMLEWMRGPEEGQSSNVVRARRERKTTLLSIPVQAIQLLQFPEEANNPTKPLTYQALREIHFVKQRRINVIAVSVFALMLRYSSFDLFLLLLACLNICLLYFMKHSREINVQLAKKAMRQRVGWAKQWAGGFFKPRNSDKNNSTSEYIYQESQPPKKSEETSPFPETETSPSGNVKKNVLRRKLFLRRSLTKRDSANSPFFFHDHLKSNDLLLQPSGNIIDQEYPPFIIKKD